MVTDTDVNIWVRQVKVVVIFETPALVAMVYVDVETSYFLGETGELRASFREWCSYVFCSVLHRCSTYIGFTQCFSCRSIQKCDGMRYDLVKQISIQFDAAHFSMFP